MSLHRQDQQHFLRKGARSVQIEARFSNLLLELDNALRKPVGTFLTVFGFILAVVVLAHDDVSFLVPLPHVLEEPLIRLRADFFRDLLVVIGVLVVILLV